MTVLATLFTVLCALTFGLAFLLFAATAGIIWKSTSNEIQYDEEGLPFHETVEFPEDSLFMNTFRINRYDDYAEEFFEDFNNQTKNLANKVALKIMIRTLGLAILGLYIGAWPAAAVVFAFGLLQQMTFTYLANYYYFTYYDLDIKLKKEDEE